MKKVVVIFETGKPDANGDIILPSAFKDIPKSVPVTVNFDLAHSVGKCEVFQENGIIKGNVDAPEKMPNTDYGVAYQVLKSHKEGDIQVIDELRLHSIAIIPLQSH